MLHSMRRLWAWRLLLACLSLLLTILGRAEIVENTKYAGPKTTLRYAMWGGADEVSDAKEFCGEFVKLHPEVRLDVAVYPWGQYWAKLQTQMASGLAPDVIEFYSGALGVWVSRGALLPLDDLVRSTHFKLDDFYPQTIANSRWNGTLYVLPTDIASWCVAYSTDLLEQSGIDRS